MTIMRKSQKGVNNLDVIQNNKMPSFKAKNKKQKKYFKNKDKFDLDEYRN